jgi:hypothetical protein
VPQPAIGGKASGPRRKRRLWIALGLLAVVAVVVVVLLVVLLNRDGDKGQSGSTEGGGDATQVTSPYDLHELPAGTGPGDVKNASLVSISLPAAGGRSDYYGLSATTPAAKALIRAISGAREVDPAAVSTTATAVPSTASQAASLATLTFLFPDRSTLAFDLYLGQGIIARGGHSWQVDGDLAALIEAAVSANNQQ